MDMKLLEFNKQFGSEEDCEKYLKEQREKAGVVCTKCGGEKHRWDKYNKRWICCGCGHETTLTSGTVMHASKLPLMYWFTAMHLLTSTKKTFSVLEIKRQLKHKRYQPIWEMVNKLRSVMGLRDGEYKLADTIELDEGYFTTEDKTETDEPLKRGVGSQRKAKVLVMVESTPVENEEKTVGNEEKSVENEEKTAGNKEKTVESEKRTVGKNGKKGKKDRKCGHLKMKVIQDLKSSTFESSAKESIAPDATVVMDNLASHAGVEKAVKKSERRTVPGKDAPKVLPWVHVAISNAKSLFKDMYHGIREEFLQLYLDEFCYKFNRRYFGDKTFDRLVIASIKYRPTFEHRIYNSSLNCG